MVWGRDQVSFFFYVSIYLSLFSMYKVGFPGGSVYIWLLLLSMFLVAQTGKNLPVMQETWVQSLGWEDPLEKGMATHSSILAGKSYGQRSLATVHGVKKELDMIEQLTHTNKYMVIIIYLKIFWKYISRVNQDGDIGGSWALHLPQVHQMCTYTWSDFFWKRSRN